MKSLQNGSDIRGIAIATSEHDVTLTDETIEKIAQGTLYWLQHEKGLSVERLTIALGRDSRLSGKRILSVLKKTFNLYGIDVLDVGLATTPAMFMATQFKMFQADCAVMVTASHLPYEYNGLKFFTRSGGAEHEDIEKILTYATKQVLAPAKIAGKSTEKDLLTRYASELVEIIQKQTGLEQPLSSFKIIVDAGNGAGGFFAEKVLQPLGADTKGSQFLEPNGHFPNHVPNPDNKIAVMSLQAAVLQTNADLGVIFDTDVDRAAVIASDGQVINRNNLIAVLAKIILAEQKGASIVTNSPTSNHLKTFIATLGGKQVRYVSGYRNVINKAIELNKAGINTPLAIETSGHAAFKENYFLDDGAYVVAKILSLMPKLAKENKTLSELIKDLKQPLEAEEVRIKITTSDYHKTGQDILVKVANQVVSMPGFEIDSDNEEGVRVNVSAPFGSGWFLIRLSLHEPLLVIQAENDVKESNQKVFKQLHFLLKENPSLELNNLEKMI